MDNEQVTGMIASSTREVFSVMLGMGIEAGAWYEEEGTTESFDGLVALVGIGGRWVGTGTLYCGTELALRMTGAMFMSEQTEVNDEVLDAMAELANMIVGNVKTALETELGPLLLSIPTVIHGRNYRALNGMRRSRMVVPFEVEGERFEVKFILMKQEESGGRVSALAHQVAT